MFKKFITSLIFGATLFLLGTASPVFASQTASITGTFSALNQTVDFTASAPTNGGTLNGNFTGACTGTIGGTYNPGNTINGIINGQCNILGFQQPFALNYSGQVDPINHTLTINNVTHSDGSGSQAASLIGLPKTVSVDVSITESNVTTGINYSDPQNNQVKVNFSSLPVTPGAISFNQATPTGSQISQYKIISPVAYWISSTMTTGSFNYDLTLPIPSNINPSYIIIRYGTTLSALNSTISSFTVNGDGTITIHNLNHFTYFVIASNIPTPVITAPVINNNNKSNYSITGTGSANTNIAYNFTDSASNVVSGTGTVAANGSINIGNINLSSLTDGLVTLQVSLDDGQGHFSTTSTSSINKDTVVPNTPVATINNPINSDNKTNITLSGSGEAGSTYNYSISDGVHVAITGTGTVNGSGTFTVTGLNLSGLNDGIVTVTGTLTDAAGNVSSTSSYTSSKDTAIPVLSNISAITSNANNLLAKVGDLISVSFTSNETIQTPAVTIAGHLVSAINTISNNWLATYLMNSSDNEGFIVYTIDFLDLAGNSGLSINAPSTISFDKTVPILIGTSVTSSNANGNFAKVGDTITLNFASGETISPIVTIAGHLVSVTNLGGGNYRATYNMVVGDTEGLIAYTINFSDSAGNAGSSVNTNSTITFDKTAPVIPTIMSPAYINLANFNSFSFSGDGEANTTVNYNFSDSSGNVSGTGTVNGSGVFSFTGIDLSSLSDGSITFTITLTDSAGNISFTISTTYTKDIVIPTINTISATSSNANGNFTKVGDLVTLTFTSNETVQTPVVTIAGHTVTATNIGGNNWRATYVMAALDTEGLINYTIAFMDLAGNSGVSVNANSSITFDRTAPNLTVVNASTSNANGSYAKVGDTITLTFTSDETLQTPVVTIAGHVVTATNVSGNDWIATYVMTGSDTEGLISYTIDFMDLASNPGVSVNTNTTITFDMKIPTLVTTITTSNGNSNFAKVGDTITLTFTASEAIQTPTVTIAGHIVTVTNTSANIWTASYVMLASDTEGLISYTIDFMDLASNPGTSINTNSSITFDITAPTLVVNSVVTSNSNPILARAGDTITLNFTSSESIQTPTVTIAGHLVTAINISGNDWTATYVMVAGDAEGFVNYTIDFQDLASNPGVSVNTNSTIIFDMTPPSLTATSISSTNVSSSFAKVGDTITLLFTATEALQAPVVTISGHVVAATNISGNDWQAVYVMVAGDSEGLINYTIDYLDLASNPGTNVNTNSSITFDSTVPTLSNITLVSTNSNPNFAKLGDTFTLTFTASETLQAPIVTIAGNAVVAINIGGNNWQATHTFVVGDTEGPIAYTIDFMDLAGNPGISYNTTSTIQLDVTIPTGIWVDPVAGSARNRTININYTTADNLSGVFSVVTFYKLNDGVDTFHVLPTAWDTSSLDLGNYTLRLVVTDNAGNSATIDEVIDIIAIITNLKAEATGNDTVRVSWDTNHPTRAKVRWDGGTTGEDESFVTHHVMTINGLKPYTSYLFEALSRIITGPYSISEEKVGAKTFSVAGSPEPSADNTRVVPTTALPTISELASLIVPTAYASEGEKQTTNEPTVKGESQTAPEQSVSSIPLLNFLRNIFNALGNLISLLFQFILGIFQY